MALKLNDLKEKPKSPWNDLLGNLNYVETFKNDDTIQGDDSGFGIQGMGYATGDATTGYATGYTTTIPTIKPSDFRFLTHSRTSTSATLFTSMDLPCSSTLPQNQEKSKDANMSRKEQNQKSSKLYRQKKKIQLKELENQLLDLRRENDLLRDMIELLSNPLTFPHP